MFQVKASSNDMHMFRLRSPHGFVAPNETFTISIFFWQKTFHQKTPSATPKGIHQVVADFGKEDTPAAAESKDAPPKDAPAKDKESKDDKDAPAKDAKDIPSATPEGIRRVAADFVKEDTPAAAVDKKDAPAKDPESKNQPPAKEANEQEKE
uniref:Uncharacterized protein n=1 Tax=Panagrolaimus sp. PS1159 TaxID=55785 RepID=A0AC35G7W6_9BILA